MRKRTTLEHTTSFKLPADIDIDAVVSRLGTTKGKFIRKAIAEYVVKLEEEGFSLSA